MVAILGADEFVGEDCLIGQPKRLATASTMTECVPMRVEKNELMRVLQDEPAFFENVYIAYSGEERPSGGGPSYHGILVTSEVRRQRLEVAI
jgi:CRP-like cAMP-binding protein